MVFGLFVLEDRAIIFMSAVHGVCILSFVLNIYLK